ncbi:hypothetical protein J2T04_001059 [Chryseobacterium lathyri]|uniref:Uncharacterized protein n=1 Tax=Chryseobacterium lathyri TaxID=395933 RepID=A0ABT9SIC4_9FLAO|nr:hypothetical protein [Chryseobacterium lathyri]
MYLKIKNKFVNYNFLGKTREEIYKAMGRLPDWCYTVDISWRIRKTLLCIEFENNIASHLSSTCIYELPLKNKKET